MMNEAKHTPGPWSLHHRNVSAGGIATVYNTDEGWVEIFSADWAQHEIDGPQQAANARLIAAAPELLALLIEGADDYAMHCEGGEDDEWVKSARAAIAKATCGGHMTDITKQLADALREGLSACNSVHMGLHRRVVRDGCALYLQTEEWCKWLEEEVSPKLREALAAYEAQAAEPKQEPVAQPHNPWRESLENCISGDNYLNRSEYYELIAELDDLYRMRAAPVAQAEPRKPLTEARLRQMHHEDEFGLSCDFDSFKQIAEAVEQEHGIKENP